MNDIVLQIVEGQQWLLGEINVLNSGVSSEINGDNGIHLVWKVGFNVQFKLQYCSSDVAPRGFVLPTMEDDGQTRVDGVSWEVGESAAA